MGIAWIMTPPPTHLRCFTAREVLGGVTAGIVYGTASGKKQLLICPEPDSNRHGPFRVLGILSPVCLPIPPSGRKKFNNLQRFDFQLLC
jgi:hypothetical protein